MQALLTLFGRANRDNARDRRMFNCLGRPPTAWAVEMVSRGGLFFGGWRCTLVATEGSVLYLMFGYCWVLVTSASLCMCAGEEEG